MRMLGRLRRWRNRDSFKPVKGHQSPCSDPECMSCWWDVLDEELWKGGYYTNRRTSE